MNSIEVSGLNPRFLVLSVAAPLVIVYLLKIFFDTLPETFDVARYAVPVAAFLVHFLAFLLCAISLVQERTMGTMERMFVNGFRRTEIIAGYVLGFLGLQDVIESGWSFEDVQGSLAVLVASSAVLLLLASLTLREVE